jgi:hypothetical protein
MKKTIHLFLILLLLANAMSAQLNWDFVGPKSTNQATDNGFETSQFSNITIDPNEPLHLFASSWWGGLWESTNRGASWLPVDINPMNANGVSAVTFISNSEILIGDSYQLSRFGTTNELMRTYSKAVWKYNFVTTDPLLKWINLGTLDNTSNIPIGIRSISIYPGDASKIFVCTSKGVYHSSNSGTSFTLIPTANTWTENMLFVPYGTPTNYFCFITGSLGADALGGWGAIDLYPAGKMMVKQSTNANAASPTFTDLSANFPINPSYQYSVSKMCMAPVDGSGNVQIFLYTKESNDNNYAGGEANIYSFKRSVTITGSNGLSGYAKKSNSSVSCGELVRMAVAYDTKNAGVWYGGIKLSYMSVATGNVRNSVFPSGHTKNGYIHDDMHDIKIQNYGSQTEMYVAHDAGIARTIIGTFTNGMPPQDPDGTILHFNSLNYGIHVSLLRGFCGSEQDSNLYVVGGHDIVNTDVYDAGTGKNRYTHETHENDGAWIDRFDKKNMFFDASEYNNSYYVSTDEGATKGPYEEIYWPAAGNTFAQGNASTTGQMNGFGFNRQIQQDPFRPGRIFKIIDFDGFSQYDPVSKTFVTKIEPWKIQPNYSETGADCGSGDWKIAKKWGFVRGMSFHRDDPNSFYFLVQGNNTNDPNCEGFASVIKYIGPNLDDCWYGHNHASYTDGSGTHPQWQNITPNWASLGISNVSDQRSIEFLEIATSPWNKNVVYVMLNVPHNPGIFIIKYDGSAWSNYSQGLPADEIGRAMVMDHQAFDAIYLSTNKKVYYREMNSGPWTVFKTGLPYVPASQMEINYAENTVRTGLYGRGIWKTDLKCPDVPIQFNNTNPAPGYIVGTTFTVTNSTIQPGKTVFRASNFIELNPKFEADAATGAVFLGYIHGCTNRGNSFARKTNSIFEVMEERTNEEETETIELSVFPNPNTGSFVIHIESEEENNVSVYNIMGQQVFEKLNNIDQLLSLDFSSLPKGIYIVKVVTGDKQLVKKVVIE